jgi:hypothetical protein
LASLYSKIVLGQVRVAQQPVPLWRLIQGLDKQGNTLGKRMLLNGCSFMIVKNFPDETEIINTLSAISCDIMMLFDPG